MGRKTDEFEEFFGSMEKTICCFGKYVRKELQSDKAIDSWQIDVPTFQQIETFFEELGQTEEAAARKRSTPCRSANFFKDQVMHADNEALWAKNRERSNQGSGSRQEPEKSLSRRNRKLREPFFKIP